MYPSQYLLYTIYIIFDLFNNISELIFNVSEILFNVSELHINIADLCYFLMN